MTETLTLAVPKGRVLKALAPLLRRAGVDVSPLLADDRTLIRTAGSLRFLLLKADDVPTYIEYGAADLGVCGRDVLREREPDVLTPLDLRIGQCTMMVAAKQGLVHWPDVPRVATKYPRTAAEHFARRGVQAEIIAVSGSVELAPLTGLSDFIVDLVETGETLRQNGLEVVEEVARVSSVLAVNRAALKLRRAEIDPLIARLRQAVTT